MAKAMVGIAAALALGMSPAWAGEEKSDEKATSDTVVASESRPGERVRPSENLDGKVVEAGHESGTMTESTDVRASFEERWLREREGLRDGGY